MISQELSYNTESDVKTILILAANPTGTSRLRLDKEVKEIDEGLRRALKREQFNLVQKWAVNQRDFYRAILDYRPQIVHFCGHGAGSGGIILEDETEQLVEVNADVLASMFKIFAKKGVECVLLNACYSEMQAKPISQYVNYVIGMNQAVGDKAAIAFSVAFYDAIAAGEQVEFAYELGCSILMKYLEQQTPVLFKKEQISINNSQLEVDIIPPNPYQGLAAFGEKDAAFFFGRETFVNDLVEAVNKQSLVGVIGPSGSGKSSVVYAGLIPQLRMTENWVIESFRPGNQPFYQLASALVRQLVPQADEVQQLRSAAGLDKNIKEGLVTLEQITSRIIEHNPGKRIMLFVDQFEELYTLCQKEEQERFADFMLQAIHQNNLTLVFTLRADFYGFVLAYRPLRDALQQFTPQLLSAMNTEELLQAIEQPAQKIEVQLEAQLSQRILDDVGNEPGNLPLLEFALTRLWSLQQNRTLTHQAYQEIGGVKKALALHAEQVYQKLSETQQKAAHRIFVQLVRPGEGTEDTRRIATRKEVGDDNWELVSYLAGYTARLVVTGHDEKSGEDTVEVVHEALIREWLTLREWMKKDRLFRAWQERLRDTIYQWEETKRDEGVLLRGVRLLEAQEKLNTRSEELSSVEQNFIQLSIEQRNRQLREEKARRLRGIAGVSGAALTIITILGGTAWYQSRQAEINSAIAEDYSLAFSAAMSGEKKGALKNFNQAVELNPNYAINYFVRGFVRDDLGDKKGALDDYNQALRLNPNNAIAYYNRGLVRSDLGDKKGTLEDYNQALRLNPNYANAYYGRGLVRSELGDKKGALDDYNQALRLNPNYALAYFGRAFVRDDLGDKKGALDDYNQALRLNPKDASTYYNRGNVRRDLGDKKGALDDYNQALRLNPKDANAYYNRGFVRSDLGDKKGALDDYNQALRLNPNDANAYYNRGIVRSDLGDKKGALEDYNQALRLNPKDADAYNNRENLRKQLGDKKAP
ncbi:WD-repeat protein [Calothrix sp. NIES-4071]|nr:WD-repeat protein [Calothrix sp. NIES-4071]BAZ54354.1 WD-repeat protein [Calothrix sp. NIES-4105]